MRSTLFRAVLIAVGIVLIGSAAVASIPDGSGVIHGCRKNSDGTLRVIDSATQSCASGWTALNWSQTGPQGPAGFAGYEVVSASLGAPVEVAAGLWVAGPVDAVCSAGKVILGGGVQTGSVEARVADSWPNGNAWRATVSAPNSSFSANVYAICAAAS